MADQNRLMQYVQMQNDPQYQQGANYFPPLTPEEQAALQKGAVGDAGWLDPLPLIGGLGWGGLAYNIARSGLPRLPSAVLGAGMGTGAYDILDKSVDRYRNIRRDAEGQPGGFYGQMPPRR